MTNSQVDTNLTLGQEIKPQTLVDYIATELEQTKFDELSFEKITNDNFVFVGATAYLGGIGAIMNPTLKTISTGIGALKNAGFNKTDVETICDAIKNTSEEELLTVSKYHIGLLSETVVLSEKLYRNIHNLTEFLYFPIVFANEVFETFQKQEDTELTYEQILLFNKFLFEESELNLKPVSLGFIKEIYQDEEFKQLLAEAVRRYDIRKNTYVINEAVLYLKGDLSGVNNFQKLIDLYDSSDAEIEKEFQSNNKEETPIVPLQKDEDLSEVQAASEDTSPFESPNQTYITIFENINNQRKLLAQSELNVFESVSDMEQGIETLFGDEENIASFYMFNNKVIELLNKYRQNNDTEALDKFRENFSKLFGNENYGTELKEQIIEKLQKEYTEIVDEFTQEIPEDKLKEIQQYIGDLILCTYITDKTHKALLISQAIEPSYNTYKQVGQLLDIINQQKTTGMLVRNFVANIDKLNNSLDGKLSNILDDASKLENLQLRIKVFYSIYNIFKTLNEK